MVFKSDEKKKIKEEIQNFISKVCEKESWNESNITDLFKNGIKFSVSRIKSDNCKCIANVCQANEIRQCSRKKKFGEFCGLHVKIKDNLKLGTVLDTKYKKQVDDIIYLETARHSMLQTISVSSGIKDIYSGCLDKCFINCDNKYYNLFWQGIKYTIDENNNVFYDDYESFIKIGKLENGEIVNI